MADGEESGGHGGNPLTNPKNKKVVAIGVGVVGVLVAYLLYSRGKRNAAVSSPNATNTPVYTSATSAGVVPGQVADAMSPADYLAQFANTIAATQGQMNTAFQNQIASTQSTLTDQIKGLQTQVNNIPPDHDQPGAPPVVNVTVQGEPPEHEGPTIIQDIDRFYHVTVLPWDSQTNDEIAGHPWQSTLWGIGQHYHEDWPTIWKANPQIANPNIIHPGQVINVPK